MSFREALRFPFDNNNINKILQIGLIFGIIAAVEIVFNGGEVVGFGTFIGLLVGLLFGLFVSGYGIFVIRNIMEGDEFLPSFAVMRSIGRGFVIFIANIIYFIPLIILLLIVFFMMVSTASLGIEAFFRELSLAMEYPYTSSSKLSQAELDSFSQALLVFCGSLIFILPVSLILNLALQVGMVRYAVEDSSGALFEFGTNISVVVKNLGKAGGLVLRLFVLGMVYGILGLIVGGIVAFFDTALNAGIAFIVFSVIFNIINMTVNTLARMSSLHLLARFGTDIGIMPPSGKMKNDDHFIF